MKNNMNYPRLISFEPIIDTHTRILILGSMPGAVSLHKQEYYGHKRNCFWKMIFELFRVKPLTDYDQKLQFLLKHRIGLWDVLSHCTREGSLDSNIRDGVANDFSRLFSNYPGIHDVLFNGTKAHDFFNSKVGMDGFKTITFWKMPSTSPANTKPYEDKLKDWAVLLRLTTK